MTATQLRATLKRLRFTPAETARRLGVAPKTVYRWLSGETAVPAPAALLLTTWSTNPHILASLTARGDRQP